MAAPVDAGRVTTTNGAATSHAVNLPGSISSGDQLLVLVRSPASTTISWPAGWSEVVPDNTADASDDVTSAATRTADGTEGATITVTFGTSRALAGIAYRITGGDSVELSAAVVGTAGSIDPPNFAPFVAHDHDVLWLGVGGFDASSGQTATAAPTNYGNLVTTTSGGAGVAGASRQLTASSENPGAFTMSANVTWTAWTFAYYTAEPRARSTQAAVEVVVLPDSPKARASQIVVETIYETRPPLRLTQLPVEVAVREDNARIRVTQIPVEALTRADNARVRVTQMPVEVLVERPAITASPFQAYIID